MKASRYCYQLIGAALILTGTGCARDAAQTTAPGANWPFTPEQALLEPGASNPFNPAETASSISERLTAWLPKEPLGDAPAEGNISGTKTDPKDSALARARLLERQGEVSQAREIYQAVLEKYPAEVLPYHRLGVLAARDGRFGEAEQLFSIALQMAPPSVELLSDYGYLLYLQNRLDVAEQVLRDALAREPYHHSANTNLGLVLGMQRRFSESLAAFRRAGSEAEAHANLAYTLTQLGDMSLAKEQYLRALKLDNTMRPAATALLQLVEREDVQAATALEEAQRRRETSSLAAATTSMQSTAHQLVAEIQPSPIGPVSYQAEQRQIGLAPQVAPGLEAARLPPVSDSRAPTSR